MAHLIPRLGHARFDSRGEARLAERLADKLEDNAYVWHNVPVGPRGRYPDFLLLHPDHGLLVLEVKDWRLEQIVSATKTHVEYRTDRGTVTFEHPLEQARRYLFAVKRLLESEPSLVGGPGTAFAGRLAVPFGWGAVLPNVTRTQFDATDLAQVIDATRIVCRDEMTESVDAEAFRARIWRMGSRRFGPLLSLPQIDLIRGLVFPEIVVRDDRQAALFDDAPEDADERVLRVMDLQQEQTARNPGAGHRVVRGVAGSGKTMLLVFRAEQLARVATRPILVLCYNRSLAARLADEMRSRGIEARVQVVNFHKWCRAQLVRYDQALPCEATFKGSDAFNRELVRCLIAAVERGHVPAGQYEAILIDEAHDEDEWLRLAARMVDPDTQSLLVLYDNAQAIYGDRRQPVWSKLGIQAIGRTTVLKLNYRNTAEILRFAWRFAAEVLAEPFDDDGSGPATLVAESCGRRGNDPVVDRRMSTADEVHAAAAWCRERHRLGHRWSEIALLAPTHDWLARLEKTLADDEIPCRSLASRHRIVSEPERDCVCVSTLHSSKGLEFPAVSIVGLGDLPTRAARPDDAVRLLYVGMTRATHVLRMSYSRDTALTERLSR